MSLPKTKAERSASPKAATSIDAFLGGRIEVAQPTRGHRAGSDAVFLAASVQARGGESVLDVGAGVGVAGLCLMARVPGLSVTAIEIDAKLCDLARKNAGRNGLSASFTVVNADVMGGAKAHRDAGLVREGYDHVIANPPFYAARKVRAAPDQARSKAHVMDSGDLSAWARFIATFASAGGQIAMIHRADALGELLGLLEPRFGDLAVFPLFPKRGDPATRIIMQGRKGSRAPTRLLAGLVLHQADGRYTDEAEAVLRGGAALRIGST